MAGHSHWAQIKHKKAKIDAQRGKLFAKLIREITVAVRAGGPNPDTNPRLRTAIENAKKANMPMETVERAIKKGTGELSGENYEEVIYEGYGPNGVAIMVIAASDNKNRTTSEIRHIFSKYGGNLGSSGCVSYLFERVGLIQAYAQSMSEEEIYEKAIDCGAQDLELNESTILIYTSPESLYVVKECAEKNSINIEKAEITFKPISTVKVEDAETAKKILKLLDALDDLDDVQSVISNFDIPEEILKNL